MIPTNNTIGYRRTPTVTYAVMAACVLAFAYQLTLSGAAKQAFLNAYALVPARYTHGAWAAEHGLSRLDPTPFVTSMFLHGGFWHIISNLWTLWIFGPALEDRLGPQRYVALYMIAGLAAGLAHFVFNFGSAIPTLGASGAIAGVIGAYARRFPYAWINVMQPIGLFPVFLYIPALVFAGLWFVAQVTQAAGSLLPGVGGGVAWWAHVGGFAVGWVLVRRLAPAPDPLQEQAAATDSMLWPWKVWMRWMTWWWRR
jgi:membrane associated rhomboid family serine protease